MAWLGAGDKNRAVRLLKQGLKDNQTTLLWPEKIRRGI